MAKTGLEDSNADETREWLAALEYVLENDGIERANFLLERLSARMTKTGASLPYTISTAYRNTIPSAKEAFMPGDLFMERRIRSLIRWNALAVFFWIQALDDPQDEGPPERLVAVIFPGREPDGAQTV